MIGCCKQDVDINVYIIAPSLDLYFGIWTTGVHVLKKAFKTKTGEPSYIFFVIFYLFIYLFLLLSYSKISNQFETN